MGQSPDNPSSRGDRIVELDALRGLAALSVLTLHYTWDYERIFGHADTLVFYNPIGRYGVELFFMLSGFLMLMTLQRTTRVRDFVVSRLSRLYPAYWCGIVLTFAVVTLVGLPGRDVPFRDALCNLTMLHMHATDVDPVYWTLKCELQFYILMAIVLTMRQARHIPEILSAFVLIHLADSQWGFTDWTGWGLWRLDSWLPMQHFYLFLVGAVLFDMRSGFRIRHGAMLSLAAFAAIQVSFTHAWITFVLALLLSLVTKHRVPMLTSHPLLFLGTISYPLYLVHQNIGFVVIQTAQKYGMESHASIVCATAVTVGLACLVTFLVEQPARRWIMSCYRRRFSSSPAPASAARRHPRFA